MKGLRIAAILIVAIMTMTVFSACNNQKDAVADNGNSNSATTGEKTTVKDVDQFAMPEEGEEIALLKTNMGDIYIRFFEDQAPKAVENFKGLINKKYYDGITFHRVIKDFMIQGGDPTGTGMGGESIWGSAFEDEVNKGLHYYNGTLAMANSGANTNGSQFFIIQASNESGTITEETLTSTFAQLEATGVSTSYTDTTLKNYVKYGGTPWLEGQYSVFGQVIKGMDVVAKIANVDTNDSDKPEKDVVIKEAKFVKYHEKDFKK